MAHRVGCGGLLASPANFLLPEKAASMVYRAKFRDAMQEVGLLDEMKAAAPEV